MGFFSRIKSILTFGRSPRYPFHVEPLETDDRPWVVLRIPLPSGENFGTVQEREAMFALEHEIEAAMPDPAVAFCDGNEVGGGEFLIFTIGRDADEQVDIIRRVLRDRPLPPGSVIRKDWGSEKESIIPLD